MRVGFVSEQVLAPVPGGTGRYAAELLAALDRNRPTGDSVTAWTAWHRRSAAFPPAARRMPLPRRALIAAWERGLPPVPPRAEVIHAPTLLAPPSRHPLVVTVHDAVPWTHPETLTARGVRWHRRMASRVVSAGAHVAVPTVAVAAELSEIFPALAAERVHVLGGGVTPALLTEPADSVAGEVARRLDLPEQFVLTIATLEPRKGLDVMLRALAGLGDRAPALLVVGQPGWGGLDIRSEAASLGLAPNRVRVLGRLPDEQLAVVLRRATLLAMPSRAEGFGLPAAEAMAVGTPVVVSDAPALIEVTGGAAVVVPRGDSAALAEAIADLTADPAALDDLRGRGLARAAGLTWDAVAARAWRLYAEIA